MRVLILGCGRIGAGLVQHLGLRGHTITVVDPDAGALARLGPGFRGRAIAAEALDRQALLDAGVERSDALAAVTARDDVNIVAARLARQVFRVPRVVARIYNPQTAEIYHRLGIQTVTSTTWAISRISDLLSYSELEPEASLGGDVEIIAASAPPLLVGRPVSALSTPGEVQVVAVGRRGKTFLPHPGTIIEAGDTLHLAALAAVTDRLAAMLRQ